MLALKTIHSKLLLAIVAAGGESLPEKEACKAERSGSETQNLAEAGSRRACDSVGPGMIPIFRLCDKLCRDLYDVMEGGWRGM